eukprot:TRINITY_DN18054_c4_g1_i1.p1 TRINITY_DN18054_c4_g1~~TRINITY_DN18054_c4_g1_i1.p1  ORF type:complete len:232 (+),score=34.15 TRINITY_DN18054_c4_g1_i1:88-696(+)
MSLESMMAKFRALVLKRFFYLFWGAVGLFVVETILAFVVGRYGRVISAQWGKVPYSDATLWSWMEDLGTTGRALHTVYTGPVGLLYWLVFHLCVVGAFIQGGAVVKKRWSAVIEAMAFLALLPMILELGELILLLVQFGKYANGNVPTASPLHTFSLMRAIFGIPIWLTALFLLIYCYCKGAFSSGYRPPVDRTAHHPPPPR